MKKTSQMILTALVAAFTLTASPALRADEAHKHGEHAAAKSGVKPYKLDTCIVSDDKLGEMGKPVVFEYKGQEVKLCCKACRKDFDKDPAKYLKKLEGK
jgi:hypothetical protein